MVLVPEGKLGRECMVIICDSMVAKLVVKFGNVVEPHPLSSQG